MHKLELLDGAMGSEFKKRGFSLPNHIWSAQMNLEAQEIVTQIHHEYLESGANYITTNTFRTTPRAYIKTGINKVDGTLFAEKSLKNAVNIAKSVADSKSLVLGSIAPLEDCYKPNLFPGNKVAHTEFRQLLEWFNNLDIDIFLIETMNNLEETEICINEALKFNKPIWVSFVIQNHNHILSGESMLDALSLLHKYDIESMLINCNPLNTTENTLKIISDNWDKRWGIYPNLGIGNPSPNGDIKKLYSDKVFLSTTEKAINLGASLIGGCCGSSPRHIRLLHETFIK